MRARTSVFLETIRVQLWIVPTIAIILAVGAAIIVPLVDAVIGSPELPVDVSAASARLVLSTIAGAMISFTALVFSITMLVLQQASSQLSPRVTRTFLRDRFNHVVLGVFVAAFVYALLVLVTVGDDTPQLSLLVALALVLLAVIAFVAYIDHMAHAIRATSVIESIALETDHVIGRAYAQPGSDPPDRRDAEATEAGGAAEDLAAGRGTRVRWTGPSGYVQAIDEERLLKAAAAQGHDLRLEMGIGAFLVTGSVVLRIDDGGGNEIDDRDVEINDAIRVGSERTMAVDPEFGIRQLVDIALRALSPGLNDPSTAGQVIDRLHALLIELRSCTILSPRRISAETGPYVIVPAPDWDAYVHLAVDEIAVAAAGVPAVRARLRTMLEDVLDGAAEGSAPALRSALASIDADRSARP